MALPVTPVTSLWRDLRDEVRRQYRGGRVLLAVDGVDGAGKTHFADALALVDGLARVDAHYRRGAKSADAGALSASLIARR